MKMFEDATRLKLRFETNKGVLSVEDLWDLPLTSSTGKANLDDIARGLNRSIKNTQEESFVVKNSNVDQVTQLKFDVVKYVIDTLVTEREAAKVTKERNDKKQKLLSLIADKQDEQLKNTSLEQLQEMVKSL